MELEVTTKVRIPKQERSILKKKKIQETALTLFCKNGYHQTTTNQIAKEAHMSVGSLYEYYANKEAILIEILDSYFEDFLNNQAALTNLFRFHIHEPNKKVWLEHLLDQLIKSHKASISFNTELQLLYFSIPQVAEICNKQKAQMRTIIYESLLEIQDTLIVNDLEAATIIFMDFLSSIVDRVVLYPLPIDSKRVIDQGIEGICRYLFGKTF